MAVQNWRLIMDHASFWLKTGTLHLPKWYMLLTEVVYTAYRNGTLSLPKTGTLLVTDYSLPLRQKKALSKYHRRPLSIH